MRLLAVYIKNLKEIYKNTCFTFTSQYEVKYEANKIWIEKTNGYEGFYGEEIEDISVIVGKNGVGKTTLLNLIGEPFRERCRSFIVKDNHINEQYFLLFEAEEDKYYIEQMGEFTFENINGMDRIATEAFAKAFYFNRDKSGSFVMDDSDKPVKFKDRIVYFPENDKKYKDSNIYCIYPEISGTWIPRIKNSVNNLTDWYETYLDLVEKQIIESKEISFVFPVNEQRQRNWKRKFPFGQKEEESRRGSISNENQTFTPDDVFCMQSKKNEEYEYQPMGIGYEEELFEDFLSNHINMIVRLFLIELKYFLDGGEEKYFSNRIRSFRKEYSGKVIEWNVSKIEEVFNKLSTIFEESINFFPGYSGSGVSYYSYTRIIYAYREFFVAIYEGKDFIAPGIDYFKLKINGTKKNRKIAKICRMHDELEELYRQQDDEWKKMEDRRYDEDDAEVHMVEPADMDRLYTDVVPQLSAGEEKMVSIIGNMIGEMQKTANLASLRYIAVERTLLFVIDEIEKEMHLEWSRRFISYLIQYLSEYQMELCGTKFKLRDLKIKIQLIMSTHSPFMLSDLHERSIIELEKNEETNRVLQRTLQEKVFAQNIQRILLNDFFIRHSFGAFAEQKVQSVIDILNNKETEYPEDKKKYCLNIIQEIGEPIVKTKLLQMYDAKFGRRKTTEQEIYDCIQRVYGENAEINIEELERKLRNTK